MENDDMLKFYKWITNIGLVLFVAFSFFYYGHIGELEQEITALNREIEIENNAIDNTTSNTAKVSMIKDNLVKVESMNELATQLNIYRTVAILFILIGLTGMGYGLWNIKNHFFPSDPDEEEDDDDE